MKLIELIENLNLSVFNLANENVEIVDAYTSDLLSDVMGKAKEGQVWITLQTHQNVAAIASLKDLHAVILVNGLKPDSQMLEYAKENDINVIGTDKNAFQISGLMYQILFA